MGLHGVSKWDPLGEFGYYFIMISEGYPKQRPRFSWSAPQRIVFLGFGWFYGFVMSHGTMCSCWLKNMSTPFTTCTLIEYEISRQRARRDCARRIQVYITGGTSIGLAGVGQGDEALTLLANFLCGDALKDIHWIRKATTQEPEQDTNWPRILTPVETPLKLAHQVGDVLANPEDYMGQYGDTMFAKMATAMTRSP